MSAEYCHTMQRVTRQRGVGMIEVLLAVVVLSIGFLASARMQVEGMQANQTALFSSQANFMLRDMTDRMRANPAGIIAGNYSSINTTTSTTLPACITAQSACSPAEIAQADLFAWRSKLYASNGAVNFIPALPSSTNIAARGTIELNAVTNTYTLSMFWSETDDAGNAQEQGLQVQFAP